jgi:hypothetical protein
MSYPTKRLNSLGLIALLVFTAVLLSSVLPRNGRRPEPAGHAFVQTGTGQGALVSIRSARHR